MESLLVPNQAVTELPGSRILVLAPHPDDEVFGCGGAILRHVDLGCTVSVVIFSDGTHGVPAADQDALRRVRRGESRAAAAILGYGEPRFLDYPDRGLWYGEKLVGEILALCAETGADLIYAPSIFEMHPDHRMLGMAAIEALRRGSSTMQLALYEVGMPLRPNCLLDISALQPRKAAAMACFVSQNARQRYDLHIAALNRYRTYTLPAAVSAAEAFLLVSAQELQGHDPLGLYRSEHERQQALGLPLTATDIPLVSVLIRSMDRPSLRAALDSVALQTYPNVEVVLVNACGNRHRDYGQWCGRFPLRLVEPGVPLGRSAAANAGLDAARGELLIFLDDDDLFLPGHVASLKDCLDAAGERTVAAYSAVQCIDASGKEIRRYGREFDALWLRVENYIPIHALLFRKPRSTQRPRFDETLDYCEDWDFWLQLLELGSFRYLPHTGAIYNTGPGTGSGLHGNEALARTAMLRIYRKRMVQWEDATLWELFGLAQFRPLHEQTLAANLELEQLLQTEQARNAGLVRELAEREHYLAERDQRIAAREAYIAALLASTSWRFTRPLRWLTGLLRGKGKGATATTGTDRNLP